ncbi:MAG: hypothetical protein J6A09_01885, partial [Alphaproteobacteria bacterium]|nr:hypothetical protein [Alphaproteobacteria bacterium]
MKKTFIVILGILICLSSNTYAVPLTAEHLYTFARQKNETLLYKYSPYINITNKNNDTAICIAAKSRDKNSFNLLKKYGASTKVECLQKMLSTALNANSTVSDGTFLGMGKLGWG